MKTLFDNYKHFKIQQVAAQTSSGQSSSVEVGIGAGMDMLALLYLGSISGTSPTAAIKIQGSDDGSTWNDLGSFSALASGDANKVAELKLNRQGYRYVRASWTLGGTSPSFTFAVGLLVQAVEGTENLNSATAA